MSSHTRAPSTNNPPSPTQQPPHQRSSSSTHTHKARPSSTATSTAPKPPTNIHSSAVISEKASLSGTYPVTIGAGAVIHPFARIQSTLGPVDIGEGCMIWERGVVGGGGVEEGAGGSAEGGSVGGSARSSMGGTATVLERQVVVETSAVVEQGAYVGHNTAVEVGARIGTGAVVGEFCKITPRMAVAAFERLDGFTVVFMDPDGRERRRTNLTAKNDDKIRGMVEDSHDAHIELLKKLVKNKLSKWQGTV